MRTLPSSVPTFQCILYVPYAVFRLAVAVACVSVVGNTFMGYHSSNSRSRIDASMTSHSPWGLLHLEAWFKHTYPPLRGPSLAASGASLRMYIPPTPSKLCWPQSTNEPLWPSLRHRQYTSRRKTSLVGRLPLCCGSRLCEA